MLKIINLTKKFNTTVAVNNLNLEVKKGEIYAFIGPNGAGKTTTIKLIMGLLKLTSGQIIINGYSVLNQPEKAKSVIGFIPDDPFVYENLTGREFLHFTGRLWEIPKTKIYKTISELTPIFPLADILDQQFDSYSRGNKQKLTILAALLHEPKLLVIDEPIVGLDPESIQIASELFSSFVKRGGTIFVCTHTLTFVEKIASIIGIIDKGKLVVEGTIAQLRKKAHDEKGSLDRLYMELTR